MEKAICITNEKAKPLFAFNASIVCFFIAAYFLHEYPSFIGFAPYSLWNVATFWLMAIAFWAMGFWVIYLGQKHFHPKHKPFLVISFAIAIIGVVLTYVTLPSSIDPTLSWQTNTYSFLAPEKLYYAVSSTHALIALYILLTYVPLGRNSTKGWRIIFEILALVALTSIIYSFIAEASTYQRIFTTHKLEGWRAPSSWTPHKNAYGRLLLVGIMSELYLFYLDKRHWRYVFIAIFGIAMGLAVAKTPLILAIVFIIGYSLYELIITAIHSRRVAIFHALIIALFVIAMLLVFLLPSKDLGAFGQLLEEFRTNATHGEGGTIDSRISIWQKCIELIFINPRSVLFGYGDYPYPLLIAEAMDFSATSGTTHNFWIEAIGKGGIIRLCFEISITLYFVYQLIQGIREKKNGIFLATLFFMGLLFQSVLESIFIFDLTMESLFFFTLTGMVALPNYQKAVVEDKAMAKPSLRACLSFIVFVICPALTVCSLLIPNVWVSSIVLLCLLILQIRLGLQTDGLGILLPFAFEIIAIPLAILYPYNGQLDWLAVIMFALYISTPSLMTVAPRNKDVFQSIEYAYARHISISRKKIKSSKL